MSFFEEEVFILILEALSNSVNGLTPDDLEDETAIPKGKILAKLNFLVEISLIVRFVGSQIGENQNIYKLTEKITPYHIAKMSNFNISLTDIKNIKIPKKVVDEAVILTTQLDKLEEIDNIIKSEKLKKLSNQPADLSDLKSDGIAEILEKIIETTDDTLKKQKTPEAKKLLEEIKTKTINTMINYRKNISKDNDEEYVDINDD